MSVGAFLREERGGATAEKRAAAKAARALIEPGAMIMIDDSTTALPLLDELEDIELVTIITNSPAVAERSRDRPNTRLIPTGGVYNDTFQGFHGLICEQMVAKLRADWAFLSASSVIETSLYHQDQDVVRMKRAFMSSAERRVLLLTPSKFKARALNHFGELAEFDHVFIGGPLEEETTRKLRQANIPFERV